METVLYMNRVNGLYERDAAITMVLIDNTDELIFFDANSDPYSNNNGGAMLGQNQSTIDQVIGDVNYDIGHVYSTGGGGIASLRSPCTGRKAQGVTGLPNPTNDPFYVDYVAHEMGHQFGGNHTQNNSCNRSNGTSVECGSGSSIMGYAGICSPNVAPNSHDNFNAVNIIEMKNHMDNGASCEVVLDNMGNMPPEVEPIANKTLPRSTPFVLEGIVTDPDMDAMLYTWDQVDTEVAPQPPVSTNTVGPAFRALPVTDSPDRYFPSIDNILNGGSQWEVLPSVSRTMDFILTARDINPGQGSCTGETSVELTFTASSGPFLVMSPNGGEEFFRNAEATITWDAAGTMNAPVSCANVDILLSTDGGLTYTTEIIAGTPNTGSAVVTMPDFVAEECRIMIKCSDSYFFDISNNNFLIKENPTRCITYASSDVPVLIPTTGALNITSDLTIRDRGLVTDLNVLDLNGTHASLGKLIFSLQKNNGSSINILDFSTCSGQNFDLNLDDDATNVFPCPPTDGGTYLPQESLSGFIGTEIQGGWAFLINDSSNQGGELLGWSIETCGTDLCDLTVDKETFIGLGSISDAIDCSIDGDTIWLENSIPGNEINILNESLLIDKNITIVADAATEIIGSEGNSTISIAANKNVSLIGFTVSNTQGTAIINNGNLTLEDMNVLSTGTGPHINNSGNATLEVLGICNLTE